MHYVLCNIQLYTVEFAKFIYPMICVLSEMIHSVVWRTGIGRG